MLKIFCLEDEIDRYPRNQIRDVLAKKHDLTIARSVFDAIGVKYVGGYDLLLLDHDMEGFYEDPKASHGNTGTAFIKWLTDQVFQMPKQIILHSQNPVGRKSMRLLLKDVGFTNVDEMPFGPDYVRALKGL